MKHFESHNNDSIVTINDTDRCVYLKHKLSLKNIPIYPARRTSSTTTYLYAGDGITYSIGNFTDRNAVVAALYIPILDRQDDESYVYAMSSNMPMKEVTIEETRNRNHPDRIGKWTNYARVIFVTDSVDNVRKIADSMEIYVFSNKIPKTDNYGMEIYGKDGHVVFNSNLLIMRLASIIRKEYPSTFLSQSEYNIGTVKFKDIKKAGLCFTQPLAFITSNNNGYMKHTVKWDGDGVDIVTEYRGNSGGAVRSNSVNTTQVLICELDGTQDIPAIQKMVI